MLHLTLFNDFTELVQVVTDYARESRCQIVSFDSVVHSPRFLGFRAETEGRPVWGITLTLYHEITGDASRYRPFLRSSVGRQRLARAMSWPNCSGAIH